jgi:hypothetical protein
VIPSALIKCPHRAGRRVGFSPLLSDCVSEISWRRLTGHPLGLRIALAFRWRAIVTNPSRDSFNRSVTVHHPHGLHLSILRYEVGGSTRTRTLDPLIKRHRCILTKTRLFATYRAEFCGSRHQYIQGLAVSVAKHMPRLKGFRRIGKPALGARCSRGEIGPTSWAGHDRASTTGAAAPGRRRARRLVMLPERQSSRAGLEAVTRAAGAAIHASRLIFPRRDAMCVA